MKNYVHVYLGLVSSSKNEEILQSFQEKQNVHFTLNISPLPRKMLRLTGNVEKQCADRLDSFTIVVMRCRKMGFS